MKGSVTGKVIEWENGETMDRMLDNFGTWDYVVFGLLLAHLISYIHSSGSRASSKQKGSGLVQGWSYSFASLQNIIIICSDLKPLHNISR